MIPMTTNDRVNDAGGRLDSQGGATRIESFLSSVQFSRLVAAVETAAALLGTEVLINVVTEGSVCLHGGTWASSDILVQTKEESSCKTAV